MVEVICDTSFLMHVANVRIKNTSSIETDIGDLEYLVPTVVMDELERLGRSEKRKSGLARAAIRYAEKMKRVHVHGNNADDAILRHVGENGGIVATMDRELKRRIKYLNGHVISVANERIVLEP